MRGLINDKIYHYDIVIRTQLNLDGSQLARLNVNRDPLNQLLFRDTHTVYAMAILLIVFIIHSILYTTPYNMIWATIYYNIYNNVHANRILCEHTYIV